MKRWQHVLLVVILMQVALFVAYRYYQTQDQTARWCLEADSSIPQVER